MKKIEIFDPAMCCPTGVCGPSIDPELMRVASAINTLKDQGIIIKRYGLSSEPQAFVANKVITELLQKEGAEVLPVTLVDGQVAKTKVYPTNAELTQWLGIKPSENPSAENPPKDNLPKDIPPAQKGGCCSGPGPRK